jgi:hypothetical protein
MSRNAFPECEREYNRREEEIEMAKDQRMGEQMINTAELLKTEMEKQIRLENALQAALAAQEDQRLEAERIADSRSVRAEKAEARAAALEEALSQMLDDMGADGFCVCPAAKEQAIAAMGGRDDT